MHDDWRPQVDDGTLPRAQAGSVTGSSSSTTILGSDSGWYYTNTYDMMKAVKIAIRSYEKNMAGTSLSRIQSWPLGFVFTETVHPALTVFPLSKTFGIEQSSGQQLVEYRMSVDVFSEPRVNVDDAKSFCMDTVDAVKKAVKRSIHMLDSQGKHLAFSTEVEQQILYESVGLKRGLTSTASLNIVVHAYHQISTDRVEETTIKQCDYKDFIEYVVQYAKNNVNNASTTVGSIPWFSKVPKTVTRTPAVIVLPGNESVREELSNGYAILARPVTFHVLSKGYPTLKTLKRNMELTDSIVTAVERDYMLGGYAQQCAIQDVTYESPQEENFNFSSTVTVEYTSRVKLETVYTV